MPSIRPLSNAVANLLHRSLRTPKEIAEYLGIDESIVSGWFEGEGFPSDRQMSAILRDFENTSGSARDRHMPGVLGQFWNELRAIEESKGDFWELPLNEGESISARLTRFTNDGWVQNIVRNIHLIHPSRRRAYVEAMTETFNQFTDD